MTDQIKRIFPNREADVQVADVNLQIEQIWVPVEKEYQYLYGKDRNKHLSSNQLHVHVVRCPDVFSNRLAVAFGLLPAVNNECLPHFYTFMHDVLCRLDVSLHYNARLAHRVRL